MSKPDIRVIVPCYNSDLTVERCISSILESKGVDFELYVADDGCNKILYTLTEKFPLKIIRTIGQSGAGKARNAGTDGFCGRVIAFIDSDVQIRPETLAILTDPILNNKADATTGCYSKTLRNNFFETYKHHYLAYRYTAISGYLRNAFSSAICAIDFNMFVQIGGFREGYTGAGPEDIITGIDLTAKGARILSVPEASGVHLASLNFIKLLKNDLRKGSEDSYVHFLRKVPFRDNRHVSTADMFAVFFACLVPLMVSLSHFTGLIPVVFLTLIYTSARISFIIKAFGGLGFIFAIKSFCLTWVLDIVRGVALINGAFSYLLEAASSGRYKPFTGKIELNRQ
jgi:glycosyltransferase involved in cell wall biosynthesis